MRVIVTGRLKQRNYETKEGEKRTVYEVEVDDVGPSLRNASAKVARANRTGGAGGSAGGGYGGGQRRRRKPGRRLRRPALRRPALRRAVGGGGRTEDPWASDAAATPTNHRSKNK